MQLIAIHIADPDVIAGIIDRGALQQSKQTDIFSPAPLIETDPVGGSIPGNLIDPDSLTNGRSLMSAFAVITSALPPKADIVRDWADVRL